MGDGEAKLDLALCHLAVRKNGIEFLSSRAFPLWSELRVAIGSARDGKMMEANGVVVDCTGNRHSGYVVSVMFFELPPACRQGLELLARQTAL